MTQNMNPFDLTGRVALVTGASRGIGAAIAEALADAGADVAIHASEKPADATQAAIAGKGRRSRCVVADLSDRTAQNGLIPAVLSEFGRLDILVNNAGICPRMPAADHPDDMWDRVLEVNLTSVFRLSRAAGRHMLERADGGKIINIASVLSFQGGITVPSYAASKGGVGQVTKALSNEWAKHRINVNAIAPGYIRTDTTAPLEENQTRNRQILERIPADRWGEPRDIGGAAVFLASRASDYVHGHLLVVDGGWMGR
jgi:2-deoxy-D-gluconate 3-dehydrogenase